MDQEWEAKALLSDAQEATRAHEEAEAQKAASAAEKRDPPLPPAPVQQALPGPLAPPMESPPVEPAAAAGSMCGGLVVTSTTHRKEWALLNRVATGPRAAEFPNVARLFQGTKQQKLQVLKDFVNNGTNLEALAAHVTATRSQSQTIRRTRRLMTIDQMWEIENTLLNSDESEVHCCLQKGRSEDKRQGRWNKHPCPFPSGMYASNLDTQGSGTSSRARLWQVLPTIYQCVAIDATSHLPTNPSWGPSGPL